LTDFQKILKCQISWNPSWRSQVVHSDRQTWQS